MNTDLIHIMQEGKYETIIVHYISPQFFNVFVDDRTLVFKRELDRPEAFRGCYTDHQHAFSKDVFNDIIYQLDGIAKGRK